MNEIIRTLVNRRSVRSFKPTQISQEELNDVLLSGLHAPSAKNGQPVRFIVIQDPAVRQRIMKMNQDVVGQYSSDPYYGAPTIILVLSLREAMAAKEDAALAIGNMYNAAYSLGLGSCWIHREYQMFESEEGKAFLKEAGITEDLIGVGSLILGYPDCEINPPKEIKEGRVFRF